MPKEVNLTEILVALSKGEDKESLNRMIERLVSVYPEKASKIAKELQLKEQFDDNNVTVTSARELSDAQKKQIEDTFGQKYSYKLDFHYKTDESILGGVVIKKGELVIENTLKTRVDQIINQIKLADLNRGTNAK